ncbi:Repeat domain-containing protein [Neolewinella agarilytica]|uniref:Repeat domain-containing protein n=2 Tax=Neolewinella agarilytica TaxID=478744 RepID=A0A1H9K9R9_9BACT|nr:Repeat domain-containing protein [Neolewinella agarilytica]
MTRVFIIVAGLLLIIMRCSRPEEGPALTAGAEQGTIAMIEGSCGSCHLTPEPGALPRHIWDTIVLPRMGQFLGRYTSAAERDALLGTLPADRTARLAANIYPEEKRISDEDWATIRSYYLDHAPLTTPAPAVSAPETDLFTPHFPEAFLSPPSTSFVHFLPGQGLVFADINKASLLLLDEELRAVRRLPTGPGLTHLTGLSIGNFATVIGSFSPTEAATGRLLQWTAAGPKTISDKLQRPTSLARLDIDQDGTEELLVSEFGKWTGRLSLWHANPAGSYTPSALSDRPGAMNVLTDTTAATPTAYVLFGQGKEEVIRFTFPDGKPQQEVVLRFPPYWGSSSLQLIDWNGDQFTDLLCTNGDNADYQSPVKAYHGIRVYTGSASGQFEEAFFHPMPGAYGARMADFNLDGHKDLAAISFFPDFSLDNPLSVAIFFGAADGSFRQYRLPAGDRGRWIVMDAADYDGDGDTDLVAGSLAMEAVPDRGRMANWIKQGLPVVVWENKTLD